MSGRIRHATSIGMLMAVGVMFVFGCGDDDDEEAATTTELTTTAVEATTTTVGATTTTAAADPADEMQLTFYGDRCVYEGATELAAGPNSLTFVNASDEFAWMEITRHTGGETTQDLVDHMGEEPSAESAPTWAIEVRGSYHVSEPGETFLWEGELEEPANYSIICGMSAPHRVWLGSVLTVTG